MTGTTEQQRTTFVLLQVFSKFLTKCRSPLECLTQWWIQEFCPLISAETFLHSDFMTFSSSRAKSTLPHPAPFWLNTSSLSCPNFLGIANSARTIKINSMCVATHKFACIFLNGLIFFYWFSKQYRPSLRVCPCFVSFTPMQQPSKFKGVSTLQTNWHLNSNGNLFAQFATIPIHLWCRHASFWLKHILTSKQFLPLVLFFHHQSNVFLWKGTNQSNFPTHWLCEQKLKTTEKKRLDVFLA